MLDQIEKSNLKIDYICAPNCLHHLFVREWKESFPDCKVIAAPNLAQRRQGIAFDFVFDVDIKNLNKGVINLPEDLQKSANLAFMVIKTGMIYEEIVLFEKEDKILVVADLIENLGYLPETKSMRLRFLLHLFGICGRPSLPTNFKLTVNPDLYRKSIKKVIAWDFKRIVVAHGRLIENNAKNIFIATNAFFL